MGICAHSVTRALERLDTAVSRLCAQRHCQAETCLGPLISIIVCVQLGCGSWTQTIMEIVGASAMALLDRFQLSSARKKASFFWSVLTHDSGMEVFLQHLVLWKLSQCLSACLRITIFLCWKAFLLSLVLQHTAFHFCSRENSFYYLLDKNNIVIKSCLFPLFCINALSQLIHHIRLYHFQGWFSVQSGNCSRLGTFISLNG